MAAHSGAGDPVANEVGTGALATEPEVVAAPANAAERRSLKQQRRGYEVDFDADTLEPRSSSTESLKQLAEQRASLAAEKKKLTGNIKRAKKAEGRLKKKAMSLSSKDLCEIIGMKTQLAKQWQEKQEKEEKKRRAEAAMQAAEQREEE